MAVIEKGAYKFNEVLSPITISQTFDFKHGQGYYTTLSCTQYENGRFSMYYNSTTEVYINGWYSPLDWSEIHLVTDQVVDEAFADWFNANTIK